MKLVYLNIWEFILIRTGPGDNHVAIKLNYVNVMLSKLRHVLNTKTLKSVYYLILKFRLRYNSLVWAQNTSLQLEDSIYFRKKPSELCFLKVEILLY